MHKAEKPIAALSNFIDIEVIRYFQLGLGTQSEQ